MNAAAALASPAPVASASPVIAVVGNAPLVGAEDIRKVVDARSHRIGGIADRLDDFAVQIGNNRVSLWDTLVVITVIAAVIAFAYFASRLATALIDRLRHLDGAQRLLLQKLATLGLWAVSILVGIDILGIDLTALTVFSGAFGLAIGFGLQKTFGNLIAGMILLFDRSIKPGDVIAIADQAGVATFGQIRRIGMRAVSVTTRDQKEYLIPNENLMINQVENWSYSSKHVRIAVHVGISYQADVVRAEELMLKAARSCKRVLAVPPPTVWMESFGDKGLRFIIQCWIDDPEEGVGNVRSDVLKTLWRIFQENGIEVPSPARDLSLRDSAALDSLLAARAKTSTVPAG